MITSLLLILAVLLHTKKICDVLGNGYPTLLEYQNDEYNGKIDGVTTYVELDTLEQLEQRMRAR